MSSVGHRGGGSGERESGGWWPADRGLRPAVTEGKGLLVTSAAGSPPAGRARLADVAALAGVALRSHAPAAAR